MSNVAMANSPLASLQDIQLPPEIGSWPPAIGYWLVLGVIIILCLALVLWMKKRQQQRRARKQALALLAKLKREQPDFSNQVNILLKRAAMSYYPRHSLASLNDEAWFTWLDQDLASHRRGQWQPLLGQRFSGKALTDAQTLQLQALAQHWLVQALPPTREQSQRKLVC
ncbi:MAG: DUF4381 domain-containing protein [Shewanella sp.]